MKVNCSWGFSSLCSSACSIVLGSAEEIVEKRPTDFFNQYVHKNARRTSILGVIYSEIIYLFFGFRQKIIYLSKNSSQNTSFFSLLAAFSSNIFISDY
jgi:hypothetical protein